MGTGRRRSLWGIGLVLVVLTLALPACSGSDAICDYEGTTATVSGVVTAIADAVASVRIETVDSNVSGDHNLAVGATIAISYAKAEAGRLHVGSRYRVGLLTSGGGYASRFRVPGTDQGPRCNPPSLTVHADGSEIWRPFWSRPLTEVSVAVGFFGVLIGVALWFRYRA